MVFHRPILVLTACFALLVSTSLVRAGDGKVSGIVTVKGQPLEAGKVFFHLDHGEFVGAKVKDGKYAVSRVPEGTRKITVEGKGVPARYASEDASGLTVEVKEGIMAFDVNLR